jgi:hypothetical protein
MRRLFQCLVVVSLILAVGGHWAFLQSVAWVSMTVEYSREGSLLEALEKTFSGEHPCKLCKVVDAGKKAERKETAVHGETKLEFLGLTTVLPVFPPIILELSNAEVPLPSGRHSSPPTPPPRLS